MTVPKKTDGHPVLGLETAASYSLQAAVARQPSGTA
jgi:hypothetical protein